MLKHKHGTYTQEATPDESTHVLPLEHTSV